MKKLVHRVGKEILYAVLTTLLGCERSHSASSNRSAASQPIAIAPADWMGGRLVTLGSHTLRQLTLPASHDSAMYQSWFPQSLARTQNLSIYQQLTAGIRYFDLRPKWVGGKLFISHGSIAGPALADVLADVQRFMAEGHHELILLKFSHYDGITPAAYIAMVGQIKSALGSWLYESLPPGKRLADITVGDYLNSAGRVLILCDGSQPLQNPTPGIWVYRDWDSPHPEQGDLRVYDQYTNTISYAGMKADQLQKFSSYDGRCRDHGDVPCDLFLLSWTLTPPTGVLAMAKTPNENLAADLAGVKIPNPFGCRMNLLYLDAVDSAVTKTAIEMNSR